MTAPGLRRRELSQYMSHEGESISRGDTPTLPCQLCLEYVGCIPCKGDKHPREAVQRRNCGDNSTYLIHICTRIQAQKHSLGRTKEFWHFLKEASRADVMLADLRHNTWKKMLPFCSGRVPILVHPSFYRSLKLRYPMDVGGITRDDRVNTKLGTGSLRQAVGILTPKDFRLVVITE